MFKSVHQAIEAILRSEPCSGRDEALIALGLRALLAAIGRLPDYRPHYIAKGGTVLRLLSKDPLERLSTDLDLSGVEFGPSPIDHYQFAADIGREATQILRSIVSRGQADISVRFNRTSDVAHRGEENPETEVYLVEVTAHLNGSNPTLARGRGYKIDVTCDEYVDQELVTDLRTTSYHIPIDVRAYAPLQSLAEKLRAILQKHRHFTRTNNSSNLTPRHLFDLACKGRSKIRPKGGAKQGHLGGVAARA